MKKSVPAKKKGALQEASPAKGGASSVSGEKRSVGRPATFNRAEEMQAAIDGYFAKCEAEGNPKTIAGLALACGLHSWQALSNYEEKPEFIAVVKAAKLQVIAEHEARLSGGNSTGSIFWLKNHAGYKDRTEQEITGKDGGPIKVVVEFIGGH